MTEERGGRGVGHGDGGDEDGWGGRRTDADRVIEDSGVMNTRGRWNDKRFRKK